jgi:hypothetical protein
MNPRCSRCPATKNNARVTLCVTVTDEVTHGVTYIGLSRGINDCMTAMMSPISFGPPRHLENAAEWLHALAELAQKRVEYFGSGSRLVWLIDPRDRTVAVQHAPGNATRVLDDAALLDGEEVLPVFSIAVVDLFRDVPA